MEASTRRGAFRWVCLGLATIAVTALLWMLNDLRMEAKKTTAAVNEHLPAVLANVKQGTDTLAQLTKDVEALRDLAGIANNPRDRSLVAYADSVLDFLDAQTGQIGVEKLIGDGLKDLVPVQEWVTAARKEALWLTFRANSKHELLERLGKTKFGSDWHFAPAHGEPTSLIEYLKRAHPESAAL